MKSGLVVTALLAVHLILGLLQATHLLPADARWFEDRSRREEFREAQAQRLVARARRDIRRWLETPEPRYLPLHLSRSLEEVYYGLGAETLRDPVIRERWEEAYRELSTALSSLTWSADAESLAGVRRACREADQVLEDIGVQLAR